MKGDVITIKHKTGERYRKMLNVISDFFGGLSEKEKDIIECIHNYGGQLDTTTRRQIRTDVGISEDYLNNYIKKLRAKKVIVENSLSKNIDFKITEEPIQYLLFAFEYDN